METSQTSLNTDNVEKVKSINTSIKSNNISESTNSDDNNSVKSNNISQPNSSNGNNSDNENNENNQSNKLKNIDNFFLSFLFSFLMGILNFIKSNWIVITILGVTAFVIYYIYSNAMNFINGFFNIFKNIQPILKSSVDMIDRTVSTIDSSNNLINSLTNSTYLDQSSENNASLENNLKHTKNTNIDNEGSETDQDEDDDREDEDILDQNTKTKSNNTTFDIDNISELNNNHKTGLDGYCFVGSENGTRSCVRIGKNDKCMSGEIFPTMEVCVNPDLRP